MINDNLFQSLVSLIRKTVSTIPDDVTRLLKDYASQEQNPIAQNNLNIMLKNIQLARNNGQTVCSGTGMLTFKIIHPPGFIQKELVYNIHQAIIHCTQQGFLRQNSVEAISGKNTGNNLGEGHPEICFIEQDTKNIEIRLLLKVGGPDNLSPQYSLPYTHLDLFIANRDLEGIQKVILHSLVKAQGKGCSPGIIGVCIGGDRPGGYITANEQFWRHMTDSNPDPILAKLEQEILTKANQLGIGPMGLGGQTTLLACKIGTLNRLPASFYVTIRYMCWAFRRQGILLNNSNTIEQWLY